jgi:hypothetical protein
MKYKFLRSTWLFASSMLVLFSCSKKDHPAPVQVRNPDTAEEVSVDRFSNTAGHLMIRTAANMLPAANAPVNFDQGPFITKGLGPGGQTVEYYNFDVQRTTPAPIYVFFKNGQSSSVPGQLNVIDVIPGDFGYNDFWQVYKVTVPDNYVANTITSGQEVVNSGYSVEKTNALVNCPVVPEGSTATRRLTAESNALVRSWYKNKVAYYFNFGEKALSVTAAGLVPLAPIFVSFKINPNLPNGGPDSGFKTEQGSDKTHNVVFALPPAAGYSPLWTVMVYDNNNFDAVNNLATAAVAAVLDPNAGNVNCPVVSIQ